MLHKQDIEIYLAEINAELRHEGVRGEIGLVGGAVMCLVYNSRAATRDVDAVFEPTTQIRAAAKIVAHRNNLPEDWLNDAAKGFLVDGFVREPVMNLSNLRVWAPEPRYMLAMKCLSGRWDSMDQADVRTLIKVLEISDAKAVFDIIASYYPKNKVPAKTQFFVEEVFDDD